ncbi:MAG TPA: spore coat protein [Bacillus bacterium]|nr:spore coat protein [Bacillus sp. (in: firmicutes)]
MEKETLAFHETMEAHEIMNFKTISVLKSKLMQGICFDNELKALMEKDVQQSILAIEELKSYYSGARTNPLK